MARVVATEAFAKWLKSLRDPIGRRAIVARLARIIASDHFGDHASVGDGVSELRIHVGPGYRIYYAMRSGEIVLLLCGGAKSSQARDIERARAIAGQLE